jgi:hypothetical protein
MESGNEQAPEFDIEEQEEREEKEGGVEEKEVGGNLVEKAKDFLVDAFSRMEETFIIAEEFGDDEILIPQEQHEEDVLVQEASEALQRFYLVVKKKFGDAPLSLLVKEGGPEEGADTHPDSSSSSGKTVENRDAPITAVLIDTFVGSSLLDTYQKCADFKRARVDGKMTQEEIDFKETISERISHVDTGAGFRFDLFRKYLGLDQIHDHLQSSPYRPPVETNSEAIYFSFRPEQIIDGIQETAVHELTLGTESMHNVETSDDLFEYVQSYDRLPPSPATEQLGVHEVHVGYDEERGEKYVSYSDHWGLDSPQLQMLSIDVDQFNFPFEVYGRIYESDFEDIKESESPEKEGEISQTLEVQGESQPQDAESIFEQSLEGREVSEERVERAREMSRRLDSYVESRMDDYIDEALKKHEEKYGEVSENERVGISGSVRDRVERARDFFVSIDLGKRENTPMERMAQSYEFLEGPQDESMRESFESAMNAHMNEIVERAFDQHLENPEQYVSHGFDHSLNVADYTREIIDQNESIVSATAEKYGISAGEAKFMLEQVALFHDCGYPHVGARDKAVHGIAGADLVSSPKMQEMFNGLITSPDAKKDKLNHDLRDSILFHSADKVQKVFEAKIETTRGKFLTDSSDVLEVISAFHDPELNPAGVPRDVTRIVVSNEKMKVTIEESLLKAAADTERKANYTPANVEVTVSEAPLRGRFADLKEKKDKKLGLEYSEVDATESPLHSVIRLADNMDMRSNRFSPTQREPAFRDIYQAMGDNNAESLLLQEVAKIPEDASSAEIQRQISQISEQLEIKLNSRRLTEIVKKKDAETLVKWIIIKRVLSDPQYEGLSEEKKQEIATIALLSNHESIRHFGGCESVRGVELSQMEKEGGVETPVVVITVNREQFDELNKTIITEDSKDKDLNISSVDVGVGEYQVWRAEEAYRSLSVGGLKVEVRVVDEQGVEIIPTYRTAAEEAFDELS